MSFAWLKSLTPRSLFGRTALILLVPILTIQIVVSYVFIQRLYENVTQQMTNAILPSLVLLAEQIEASESPDEVVTRVVPLGRALGVNLAFEGTGAIFQKRRYYDLSGRVVERVLREGLEGIGPLDLASNDRRVRFLLNTQHGPISVGFARDRVSASNPHQLLVLMVFVAAIVTLISFLFLKNQVRPIRRLANAASAFGKGKNAPYRPTGATEVRQAGTAFLEMRARIERHIEQRTLLLSGVSHDLRTPLTRMKLALSLMPESPEQAELMHDVDEMRRMLDTFLDFAQVDATEGPESLEPAAMASRIVSEARAAGGNVSMKSVEGHGSVELRPMAVERALQNLIGNAVRYGTRAQVSVVVSDHSVRFTIEDDGPGIPDDRHDEAVRPFTRLDPARNLNKGGSVGLGLSIVHDVARQHGGSLQLSESKDLGGLRVDLVLAR